MILSGYKSIWDKLSIGASVACSIHCIILPLAFTTLPLLGVEMMENLLLELATIAVSALLGGWAIYKGYRMYHRNKRIVTFFVTGIAFLIIGNLVTDALIEMSLKLAGAILLITAHLRNRKLCTHCTLCQHPQNA